MKGANGGGGDDEEGDGVNIAPINYCIKEEVEIDQENGYKMNLGRSGGAFRRSRNDVVVRMEEDDDDGSNDGESNWRTKYLANFAYAIVNSINFCVISSYHSYCIIIMHRHL